MMVIDPFMIPDPPIPATALAMINMVDDTDTPHSNEPSSNIARKERKVNCSTVKGERKQVGDQSRPSTSDTYKSFQTMVV